MSLALELDDGNDVNVVQLGFERRAGSASRLPQYAYIVLNSPTRSNAILPHGQYISQPDTKKEQKVFSCGDGLLLFRRCRASTMLLQELSLAVAVTKGRGAELVARRYFNSDLERHFLVAYLDQPQVKSDRHVWRPFAAHFAGLT